MFSPGDRVDNYTLVSLLGKNAFGPVWSARESILNRLIRINFLATDDEYQINRFSRAISLLSRLNHPAVVAHTGHGFIHYRPYLATEHVQGPTLATLTANGGRMDELRVLQIATQVAEGLDHAWRTAEIIHRNLSPETILVDLASLKDEDLGVQVKIIDFGHALGRRLVDRYDAEAVAAEAEFQRAAQAEKVGNLLTMAPEQIRGSKLTPAADMYALGVTMYLLLTGKPPFTGSEEEIRSAHVKAMPLDLAQMVPGLQSGTAGLVRRLLDKNPNGRFPDWATCHAKLQALRDQLERRRRPRPLRENTTPTGNRRLTESIERTPLGQPALPEPQDGDSSDGMARRRTESFDRTPLGRPVRGGVQGGGAPPLPEELDPAAAKLPRKTETYDRTPLGVPILGGVQGGGAPPLPEELNPQLAAYRRLAAGREPSPPGGSLLGSMADHQLLFALLAERVRHDLTPQAAPAPAANAAPTVDDGLTAEQRAAVWAYLFRNPAIREASVSAAKAVLETPVAQDTRPLPPAPTPAPAPTIAAIPPLTAPEEPIAPELEPAAEERNSFANLFVAIEDGKAKGGEPVAAVEQPAEPAAEVARNPAQSPWWKPALEILRGAVIGRVRYQAGEPASLTKRFTATLRRLVASRDSSLAEVVQLTEAGKFDAAENLLDQVAAGKGSAGNDDQMCLLRSRVSALRGDFTNALRWAQMAVQQKSTNPLALATVGYLHLQGRRVRAAIAIFDEATNLHPQSALGPLGQATILFLAGLDAKAGEAFAEAANRENHPGIIRLAALRCRAQSDIDGEISLLRQLLTGTAADWEINERIQELVQTGLAESAESGPG